MPGLTPLLEQAAIFGTPAHHYGAALRVLHHLRMVFLQVGPQTVPLRACVSTSWVVALLGATANCKGPETAPCIEACTFSLLLAWLMCTFVSMPPGVQHPCTGTC